MAVIGSNEQDNKTVAVRGREEGDLGSMSAEELIKRILDECCICSAC
jgi:threonyl-tRNA synthetase